MRHEAGPAEVALRVEAGRLALGLRLEEAPYRIVLPATDEPPEFAARLVHRLARALGREPPEVTVGGADVEVLAAVALTLDRIARDEPLAPGDDALLPAASLPPAATLVLHTDGSFDPLDDHLGLGYTLNGQPHALTLPARDGVNGARAEREAIRVALAHAVLLGDGPIVVRSDHVFHVRRYAENLVHRGRRKSGSLERLDALVASLGDRVHFERVETHDADAPHRLATHARALRHLALDRPLSRAQAAALRRVHFALRSKENVRY